MEEQLKRFDSDDAEASLSKYKKLVAQLYQEIDILKENLLLKEEKINFMNVKILKLEEVIKNEEIEKSKIQKIKTPNRTYSLEFKYRAIKIFEHAHRMEKTAAYLGIPGRTLKDWVTKQKLSIINAYQKSLTNPVKKDQEPYNNQEEADNDQDYQSESWDQVCLYERHRKIDEGCENNDNQEIYID
jgi:hypothetical protein